MIVEVRRRLSVPPSVTRSLEDDHLSNSSQADKLNLLNLLFPVTAFHRRFKQILLKQELFSEQINPHLILYWALGAAGQCVCSVIQCTREFLDNERAETLNPTSIPQSAGTLCGNLQEANMKCF